jgi:tRNA(Leu) C34 or U34 (ribose-2'-O)-methylase TrmL
MSKECSITGNSIQVITEDSKDKTYKNSIIHKMEDDGSMTIHIPRIENKIVHYYIKVPLECTTDATDAKSIGSLIRTINVLNTKILPQQIRILIDLSICTVERGDSTIKTMIHKLQYVSMTTTYFMDIIFILSAMEPDVSINVTREGKCHKIIALVDVPQYLNDKQPFPIPKDSFIPHDIMKTYMPKKHYIVLHWNARDSATKYAPIAYHQALKVGKELNMIICSEKVPNVLRLFSILMSIYNEHDVKINVIITYLESKELNVAILNKLLYDNKDKYNQFNFIGQYQVLSVQETVRYLQSSNKTKIMVDLHEKAINLRGNAQSIIGDDKILVFGGESQGIPSEINQLADLYVQLEARKSLNVISTVSIFLHEAIQ